MFFSNLASIYDLNLLFLCCSNFATGATPSKEIYNNSIPNSKVNELKSYLLKTLKKLDGTKYTKLEELVKLAKKKRTSKKHKNGMPIVFKFPSKLLKPATKGGFRKTVKRSVRVHKKTLKKY